MQSPKPLSSQFNFIRRTDGPNKRERMFLNAVSEQLTAAVDAGETGFSPRRQIAAACKAWDNVGQMKDKDRQAVSALAKYENMLTHQTVRDCLRAAFTDAGFAPMDAARNLASLACGKATTVVTKVREGEDGFVEVTTTQHAPNMSALKAYYEMTHEQPPSRNENVNLNIDVLKHAPPSVAEDHPRAVGALGPAQHGDVNVFAEHEHEEEAEE
jgi:hypothetical protein